MKEESKDIHATQRMAAVPVDTTEWEKWFIKNRPATSQYEKSALRSKKFLGYFFSDMLWKGLIALMVVTWQSGWVGQDLILAAVVCSTVVQITYLISQALVDRSVRIIEIKNRPEQ